MNHLFPLLPILHSILTFFFCILIAFPAACHGDVDEQYAACNTPFNCGSQVIKYPFWGIVPRYCGRRGFELQCIQNALPTIQMGGESGGTQSFRVLELNYTQQIMTIAAAKLFETEWCSSDVPLQQTSFHHDLFSYSENVRNISLFFNCSSGSLRAREGKNYFFCSETGDVSGFYKFDDDDSSSDHLMLLNLSNSCSSVVKVPFQQTPINLGDLSEGKLLVVLKEGFQVRYDDGGGDSKSCWECYSSGGICGSNETSNEFACLCPDQPHSRTCPPGSKNLKLKLSIGISVGIIGISIICTIICIFRRVKSSSILSALRCREVRKSDQDLEAFIRNYGSLAPKRYSFTDVKKMTDSFKYELGQGGYGRVYKGKLSDGQLIAVKLLNTSKGNGQEFVNEIGSISRTSHVNVVTLLGFCLEGGKRGLIYEFMPNGSLEKFIYKGGDASKPCLYLAWKKMYEIFIAIAKGLEYLHRGCNTRILHLDIKPHNILLDEEFCPKISDFGLAKLCLEKESIVSMLEARGTIGYIAPEVFNRNFGEVSHKSDVYSYGMMILELVGCKNNLDTGADRSSEIYFPHWIYKHFERNNNEFKVPGVLTSKENEIASKMIVVGLWCIQTHPSDRPSMNKVIEMLQSSTDALEIPAKPFASSPPRPPIDSSTIATSSLYSSQN